MRFVRPTSRSARALRSLVLGLICTGAHSVQAKTLREKDVVSAILSADPRLAQSQAQIELARAQVQLAMPRWSPNAYYSLEHFGPKSHLDQEHELGAGATLVAPHQKAAALSARVQQELARYRATRIVHARVMAGLRRFYRIVALQERLKILELWKEGLQELVRIASARVSAGEAPEYEQLRIELALRSANSEIRVAQARMQAEQRTFADFLGLKAAETLFQGALLPSRRNVEKDLADQDERPSTKALNQSRFSIQEQSSRFRRAWIPSLSFNGGLRFRRHVNTQHWGFGVGLSAAFPNAKRTRAVKEAAVSSQEAIRAQVDTARFDARQAARRSGLLCLALLEERERYIQEIQQVLYPLEAALTAEYREGQRDVVGLMSVMERSMQSRRYRLNLALQARDAELDFRDAKGVFER